jgi:predicted HicB family RNase H-like nuclease
MATMEYKGYVARIDTDEENDGFHGSVINISDTVNFKGRSMKELRKEFGNSMEEYFKFCKERGRQPDQPFSGKFVLRVDPAVHCAITRAAEREGVSINSWVEAELERAAAG